MTFAVRFAAVVRTAARTSTAELYTSVLVSLGFLYDEMQETVVTAVAAMCPAVTRQLVRVDWDVTDGMTLPAGVALALRLELEPFLIGFGEIVVEDAANHFIVRRTDPGEIDGSHASSPEITPR